MRPTKAELDKKTWYRLLKVLSYLILVGAFIAPWMIHKPDPWLIMDSLLNLIIWLVLIYLIQNIILYVLYGKKEVDLNNKEKKKDILRWIAWSFVSVVVLGLLIIIIIGLAF